MLGPANANAIANGIDGAGRWPIYTYIAERREQT